MASKKEVAVQADDPPPVAKTALSKERVSTALQFNPGQGKLPPPEIMAMYAAIDPTYPAFLQETFKQELRRNFIYQMTTWIGAISFATVLATLAAGLAYADHPKMASAFLGANILGIAVKLLAKSKRGQ